VNNFYSNWHIAGNQFLKMLPRADWVIVPTRRFCWPFAGIAYKPFGDQRIFSPSWTINLCS
jgi:hypothetical protein